MQDVCKALERIARLAESADEMALKNELKTFREMIAIQPELRTLENELKVWQEKLSVIFQEPIGRKGMAKHARFWAQRLRS